MQPDRRPGPLRHRGHAEDVIDVGVCEPDRHRSRADLLDFVKDQTRFLPRVYDRALARLRVHNQIRILGKHAVWDLDDHFLGLPSCCCSRSDLRYFSTAIAAVVASPTAVVIWRVTGLRTSPAANRPAIDVIIRLSVIR